VTGDQILTFSGAPVWDEASAIACYLERFRQGHGHDAFHGLLELEHAALPDLAQAFQASADTSMRAFLLNVIWQHRQSSEIPLLAEALFDREPEIWREAMDGLVTFACPESVQALHRAKTRHFTNDRGEQLFIEWLEETIGLAES
jgi:hypothetical protein